MSKSGALNSPVGDDLPYQMPEIDGQKAAKAIPKTDWARLGNSRKYKAVDQYLETRMEYYRHFLPGGQELKELAITDPAKAGQWAAVASCIVDELDTLRMRIQRESTPR